MVYCYQFDSIQSLMSFKASLDTIFYSKVKQLIKMTSCLLRYQQDGARGAGGIELFTLIAPTVIACLAVDNVNVLETISKNSRPLPGIIAAVLHKNAVSLRERETLTLIQLWKLFGSEA